MLGRADCVTPDRRVCSPTLKLGSVSAAQSAIFLVFLHWIFVPAGEAVSCLFKIRAQ